MAELDQLRRNVEVLDLLERSWRTWNDGDRDEGIRLGVEAAKTDASAYSVITGGMRIGEIPQPGQDGWDDYVDAARERLAQVETAGDQGAR